ncbi:hypothetical protein U5801_24495 [Lamprobacter modestohalophilus]|uniref:hypothetical protein n=1 Tax=Lamprobacter modestohalophilus TaxID=1064514 RepID=UPI002ADEB335|nr:hypothetical protein [Lamprobacter modestohalophilus]MEA1052943.1 hypothetical protein [Lamprobacter modestohalophilus]
MLEETLALLDLTSETNDVNMLHVSCIQSWPQKSESNKEKLWQHMKYRFLEIECHWIKDTPFLKMFRKIRNNDEAVQDLIFFQLCITTPILLETLSLLATDSFLNTGEAVFSRYHLDQLLERKYERMPQSTRDRVRSILVKAGRLKLSKSNYSVTTYCPTEAVVGYALYHDASKNGWRAPSTATVINEGTIAPIFMCNRALLIAGLNKLATKGHCEYHRHGSTDQVQLIHQSLEEYVDAWR